ncbi:MAG: hypothetical protein K8S56_10220 [Candidatus Cloacimonetes bacterium]|nr:hypothetical protein [Candidatus Cloacimonadota bacterium]
MLVILLLLVSCAVPLENVPLQPLEKIEKYKHVSGFDFSSYNARNFMVTPRGYNGKYEPLGMLNFVVCEGAAMEEKLLFIADKHAKEAGLEDIAVFEWIVEELDYNEILEYVYQTAISMGGNAVVDFRITRNDKTYVNSPGYPGVTVPGVEIYGFVIRRLNVPLNDYNSLTEEKPEKSVDHNK